MQTRSLAASILSISLAVSLAAAGCSSDDGGSGSDDQTLVYWASNQGTSLENDEEILTPELEKFTEQTGVEVELEVISWDNLLNRILAATTSGEAPDVLNIGNTWSASLQATGAFVPFDDAAYEDIGGEDKFLETSLTSTGAEGETPTSVPLYGLAYGLFYNKKVFADHGVQPPRTWTELMAAVDRFKSNGIIPFALAGGDSWTELVWPEYLVDRVGGAEVFNRIAAGEKDAWRDPAITKSIDMIRQLVDRGGFGDSYASVRWDGAGASTLIAQGKAAMHLMGSWEYTNQVTDQPEYAKNDQGFIPFPTVEGGIGDPKAIVGNPTNYFSVSKDSKSVDAAIEFLKQEMSSDAYVEQWLTAGDVPAVTGLESKMDKAADPAFAKVVYDMVNEAPTFQLSWDQAIDRAQAQPMLDALAKVFLGQLDAAGFVKANEDAA